MWFDGYDGHTAALLDDFAGKFSKFSLNNLLRLLDRYKVQFPIKGGYTFFQPRRIFLTTNIHPREWYDWTTREVQYPALSRRITRVVTWRANGTDRREHLRETDSFKHFFSAYLRRGQSVQLDGPVFSVTPSLESVYDFVYQ
jgi:hypothetical protein